MFKKLPLAKWYRLIGHGPCVLIVSGTMKKANAAPVAWTTPINDEPPLIGISLAESHFTTELIKKNKTFTVNIPDVTLLMKVIGAGSVSGRKGDKIGKLGFEIEKGKKVPTPHLPQCLGYLECRVRDSHRYDGVIFFVADVLNAQVRASCFSEYWIPSKARTIHHLGGGKFVLPGKPAGK